MQRIALLISALILLTGSLIAQQQTSTTTPKASAYSAIPVTAAKAENPVKTSPESLARAKRWWTLDCEMCHGKNGEGKGDTAKEMKLTLPDFSDSATLKDHSDGELYYIIKNGHNDMPAEGQRITTEQGWDLVNYVRSLGKKKEADAKTDSAAKP